MVTNITISKPIFDFLGSLEKNNNREWFEEHKSTFQTHQSEVKSFFEAVKESLSHHDEIEKMKMFRILELLEKKFNNLMDMACWELEKPNEELWNNYISHLPKILENLNLDAEAIGC